MNESLGVIDHVLVGLIAWIVLSVPVAVGAARFIAVGNRPDEAHQVPACRQAASAKSGVTGYAL